LKGIESSGASERVAKLQTLFRDTANKGNKGGWITCRSSLEGFSKAIINNLVTFVCLGALGVHSLAESWKIFTQTISQQSNVNVILMPHGQAMLFKQD
jgi:hypothetical protein